MRPAFAALAGLVFLNTGAFAADLPDNAFSFCVNQREQDHRSCLIQKSEETSKILNNTYATLLKKSQKLEQDTFETTKTEKFEVSKKLEKSQKSFIEYREHHCEYVVESYTLGSGGQDGYLACTIDMNNQRINLLKTRM